MRERIAVTWEHLLVESADSKFNSGKFAPKMSHSVNFISSGIVLTLLVDSPSSQQGMFSVEERKVTSNSNSWKAGKMIFGGTWERERHLELHYGMVRNCTLSPVSHNFLSPILVGRNMATFTAKSL